MQATAKVCGPKRCRASCPAKCKCSRHSNATTCCRLLYCTTLVLPCSPGRFISSAASNLFTSKLALTCDATGYVYVDAASVDASLTHSTQYQRMKLPYAISPLAACLISPCSKGETGSCCAVSRCAMQLYALKLSRSSVSIQCCIISEATWDMCGLLALKPRPGRCHAACHWCQHKDVACMDVPRLSAWEMCCLLNPLAQHQA